MRVQHKNGTIETIDLGGALQATRGEKLDHIVTETGLQHYFTKDGFYDGWASADTPELADEITQVIERHRQFDGQSGDIPATN